MSASRRMISSIVVALEGATAFGQVSLTTSGVPYVQASTLLPTQERRARHLTDGDPLNRGAARICFTQPERVRQHQATRTASVRAQTLSARSAACKAEASFINNTGVTITSLAVLYTGEQWRCGATGRADRLDFQLSTNATSLAAGTYVDYDNLDFSSPSTTATDALDGNAVANRVSIALTITGLNIR